MTRFANETAVYEVARSQGSQQNAALRSAVVSLKTGTSRIAAAVAELRRGG